MICDICIVLSLVKHSDFSGVQEAQKKTKGQCITLFMLHWCMMSVLPVATVSMRVASLLSLQPVDRRRLWWHCVVFGLAHFYDFLANHGCFHIGIGSSSMREGNSCVTKILLAS